MIYFDHAAAMPVLPEVKDNYPDLLEKYSGAERARMLGVLHQNIQCELDFTLYEMIFIVASGRFPRLKRI